MATAAAPVAVATAPPASASTTAELQVCRPTSAPGAYSFVVNHGRAVRTTAACTNVRGLVGRNIVQETAAPNAFRHLSGIHLSAGVRRPAVSVTTATAAFGVRAGQSARVTFVNARVAAPGATGTLEICKYAVNTTADPTGGSFVTGTFTFTVKAGTTTLTESTSVGQCTLPFSVPAGNVTITESSARPYYLASVTTMPSLALVSANLGARTATVAVASTGQTTVNFKNSTSTNFVKVCKILANNQGGLAGSTFSFTGTWSFLPPTAPAGSMPMTGTQTASVVAVAAPGGACTFFPLPVPVGATVTVSENSFPDVAITGVKVVPAAQDAGSTPTTAVLTVPAPSLGPVDAVFTNEPLGVVEVCKAAADPSTAAMTFNFTVNGGTPFPVAAGSCSAPIPVPAGTAMVQELGMPNFYLVKVSTVSATDPTGSRLLSSSTANPAKVAVPYGDVGNETIVTFTNAVLPASFKICKQETSADANLTGATFNFTYSYTDISGAKHYGTVALTIGPVTASNPTGEVCSGMIGYIPAVDPSGNPVPVTVTEQMTTIPGVEADSILYQGSGAVTSQTTLPVVVSSGAPGAGTASVTFNAGAGANVVTFTNGRTPPPSMS